MMPSYLTGLASDYRMGYCFVLNELERVSTPIFEYGITGLTLSRSILILGFCAVFATTVKFGSSSKLLSAFVFVNCFSICPLSLHVLSGDSYDSMFGWLLYIMPMSLFMFSLLFVLNWEFFSWGRELV